MNKLFSTMLALVLCFATASANDSEGRPVLLLTGASFAIPENGWFEIACEDLGAEAINKAVSGEAIYHTARRMDAGTFYSTAELDRTDVFVIGHVHNQNVANEQWLKENWEDYTNIATTTDYSVAYDYVIKRYIADCRALKDNPDSKYYGTPDGKPVKIVLCTHWHDSRTTYNPAVRKLAQKWGFPLVEFDTNIGFSKDDVAAGETQPSIAMAHDTETIGGVKYGWHPLRGSASHVQRRMAQIFLEVAADVLGVDVPFECTLIPVSPLVLEGESAAALMAFRAGHYPFAVEAKLGTGVYANSSLADAPVVIETTSDGKGVNFAIEGVTDARGMEAVIPEGIAVGVADKVIACDYDAYIHEAYKEQSYTDTETLQLKTGDNWGRKIYLSFPIDGIDADKVERIAVRLFFDSYTLGTRNGENRPMDGIERLDIEGNTKVYDSKLKWSTHTTHAFEPVASTLLTKAMHKKWIGWDVTAWAKEKIKEGAAHLTFRISSPQRWGTLSNFIASESTSAPECAPQMLISTGNGLSGAELTASTSDEITIEGDTLLNPSSGTISIFNVSGAILYSGNDRAIALGTFPSGVYIAATVSKAVKFIR